MGAAHFFVTMGNILNLACDAWMVPTDERLELHPVWTQSVPGLSTAIRRSADADVRRGTKFAFKAEGWPAHEPLPVFTAVPLAGVATAADLRPRIREFLRIAAEEVADRRRDSTCLLRARPLIALPFFGTGAGGGDLQRGDIMQEILTTIAKELPDLACDVVLVLRDEAAFALAQELRRRHAATWWPALSDAQRAEALKLAAKARDNRLVPFLGAGISFTAGIPSWTDLLGRLAERVGLDAAVQEAFDALSPLDQAGILQSLHQAKVDSGITEGTFGELVASEVTTHRYGLSPTLLANLPSDGAITLNYDTLFESASADAGRPRAVIPPEENPSAGDTGSRWLLKLHGSATRPETIVLTRDDYLGYNANREALSALVKAHLMTHHLLFVGFGLKDNHFHEIVHDVRRALPTRRGSGESLGTVLSLDADPLQKLSWEGRLDFVDMTKADDGDSGRLLEVFLDLLICHATESHSYFLAPKFDAAVGDDEKELRQALLALKDLRPANGGGSVTKVLNSMLRSLGCPD